ncbi:hypothetical protein [Pseudomonas sp. LS-2]|uniref:hypothetical protein n=1 Tax=Pseudomonas sp. LS-2 TaxID=2315859 RepID=UPI000E7227F9|nr:hypothetical protein [Pseudomonas sp. LS-2]RJX74913.1 hypothetical protein D3M70_26395 [Pseudomonas sp. LS-2]
MKDQSKLPSQGYFPNKRVVEYATVLVDLAHKHLPSNLKNPNYEDDDLVAGLYVSPNGRLTYDTLYLDDLALAEAFASHLDVIFQKRKYAGQYALRVEVATTTQTVTATKQRLRCSEAVRSVLSP